eukprot:scaffold78982_cov26-Tisochrysis_lutea.AAC.1
MEPATRACFSASPVETLTAGALTGVLRRWSNETARRCTGPPESGLVAPLRAATRRCRIASTFAMLAAWCRRRTVSSRRWPRLHDTRLGVASMASMKREIAAVESAAFCDASESSESVRPCSLRLPRMSWATAAALLLSSPTELSLSISIASPASASRQMMSDLAFCERRVNSPWKVRSTHEVSRRATHARMVSRSSSVGGGSMNCPLEWARASLGAAAPLPRSELRAAAERV